MTYRVVQLGFEGWYWMLSVSLRDRPIPTFSFPAPSLGMCGMWLDVKSGMISDPWWLQEVSEWFEQRVTGNNLRSLILRCSFTATIYFLWFERNQRVFQHKSMPEELLVWNIVGSFRDYLCSLSKVVPSAQNKHICLQWGIPATVSQSREWFWL